ncbi:MAG TPA: ATP-binding protein, partial [Gemmatirosa sp.]
LRDVARALAAGDLSNRPALAAPGEIGEVAGAVHRLAEQLGARLDALAAEQELLAALTESLSEGVVAVDARGQVVRVNDTARRLLRLPDTPPFPSEYLPRDRGLREALAAALRGELVGGEPVSNGTINVAPTGEHGAAPAVELRVHGRTLALTARPLPAARGAVLAFHDLTAVRRLETVRRDFVANVSHELKTPLTVVGGFAETLADDVALADAPRRFAQTIRANATRMQRIVDDLLDLSRIESGGWRPAPTAVSVVAAAADALGPARDAAAARGITLDIAPDPDAPCVYADPTAARQVLSNLVENAVRHTPTGHVTVYTRRDPSSGDVWLGVRDTGVGISAAHLPRIFERFYRADPGRSREQGGTGLGLSVVKHLAEAHGGEARAASTLGEGTTIEVRFPTAAGPSAV